MSGEFKRIMNRACDRTKPRKDGVLVMTADWHALMDLAASPEAAPAPVQGEVAAFITQGMLDDLRANRAVKYRDLVPTKQRDHVISLYLAPPPTDAEAVRRAALEEAACLADAEQDIRLSNMAAAKNGSHEWGEPKAAEMAQGHKAVTAGALARAIRALSSQPPATEGWRDMASAPKDETALVVFAPTEKNKTYPKDYQHVCPVYFDETGRICDAGTWRPDPGIACGSWKATLWQPLPAPPARGGEDA